MSQQNDSRPAWPGLWQRDEKGAYLVGGRCTECRKLALGMREFCPHCHSEGCLREERVGRSGEVYTATLLNQGPPAFKPPYRVGYVDIEDGVRVFAHISHGEGSPVIGDRVWLDIQDVASDKEGCALSGPVYIARNPGEAG